MTTDYEYEQYGTDTPTLGPEEERRLMARYKRDGDLEARDALIQAHMRIVYKYAKQWLPDGVLVEDVQQEGWQRLCEALDKYDPENGASFGGYAKPYLRRKLAKRGLELKHGVTDASLRQDIYRYKKARQDFEVKNERTPEPWELASDLYPELDRDAAIAKTELAAGRSNPASISPPSDEELEDPGPAVKETMRLRTEKLSVDPRSTPDSGETQSVGEAFEVWKRLELLYSASRVRGLLSQQMLFTLEGAYGLDGRGVRAGPELAEFVSERLGKKIRTSSVNSSRQTAEERIGTLLASGEFTAVGGRATPASRPLNIDGALAEYLPLFGDFRPEATDPMVDTLFEATAGVVENRPSGEELDYYVALDNPSPEEIRRFINGEVGRPILLEDSTLTRAELGRMSMAPPPSDRPEARAHDRACRVCGLAAVPLTRFVRDPSADYGRANLCRDCAQLTPTPGGSQ